MKTNPGNNGQSTSVYDKSLLAAKEELTSEVELIFAQAEEGLEKWQKNWSDEEIFNRVTSKFETIKELFAVVSERSEEFAIEETDRYNKKFYDLYNSIINKGNEYRVIIPWPRRNFGR